MELRETAACGVAEREFTIDLSSADEIKNFTALVEAGKETDEELAADLIGKGAEGAPAGSISIEMGEAKVRKLHEMIKAAGDVSSVDPDFIEELSSYMQHVVGIEG